jgi:hypothetical protein
MNATTERLLRLCAPQLQQLAADAALAALIERLRTDERQRPAA